MDAVTWDYRCSLCQELVAVGDMNEHAERHRASPDWPGFMAWLRVDRDPPDSLGRSSV